MIIMIMMIIILHSKWIFEKSHNVGQGIGTCQIGRKIYSDPTTYQAKSLNRGEIKIWCARSTQGTTPKKYCNSPNKKSKPNFCCTTSAAGFWKIQRFPGHPGNAETRCKRRKDHWSASQMNLRAGTVMFNWETKHTRRRWDSELCVREKCTMYSR